MKWGWLNKLIEWIKGEKKSPVDTVPPAPPVSEIPTKEEVETFPTSSPSKFKKIALIIGHGYGDSGAIGWNKMEEHDYNKKVAYIVQEAIKDREIRLFWRGKTGITGVNGAVRAWDDDLSIELHLNSYNGKAFGCEVLTLKGDKVSVEMGRFFAREFCKKFNRTIRNEDGVKELSSSDRGHYSLALVNDPPPSILVEPFFIDNKNEWIEPETYAAFLIEWIKKI